MMKKELTEKELFFFQKELCRYSKRAAARGLLKGPGGLLSVQIPDTDRILVTPKEIALEKIQPQEIILLDVKGNRLTGPKERGISEEVPFLLDSYKRRRNVFAIGHFHPPYTTAFSNTPQMIPFATNSSKDILKEILRVKCKTCPSRFAGHCECVEGQRKSYGGVNILLVEADGLVTLGQDLKGIFNLATLVEHNARSAYFLSKLLR